MYFMVVLYLVKEFKYIWFQAPKPTASSSVNPLP